MPFNYVGTQALAAKLIRKFGMPAKLLRSGIYRDCIVVETGFTPGDARGKMANPTDRIFLVAAEGLSIPPNMEAGDVLVTFYPPDYTIMNETLKIREPVGRLSPAGLPVYWEMMVSR